MLNTLRYFPMGVVISTVILVIWKVILKKNITKSKSFLLFVNFVYITIFLMLTFFSREAGSREEMELTLGATYRNEQGKAFFYENILLFIPYGLLMPITFPKFSKIYFCIGSGVAFSVTLEMAQFITGRGFFQLDDIVTNTCGVILGWMGYYCIIYMIGKRVRSRKKYESKASEL